MNERETKQLRSGLTAAITGTLMLAYPQLAEAGNNITDFQRVNSDSSQNNVATVEYPATSNDQIDINGRKYFCNSDADNGGCSDLQNRNTKLHVERDETQLTPEQEQVSVLYFPLETVTVRGVSKVDPEEYAQMTESAQEAVRVQLESELRADPNFRLKIEQDKRVVFDALSGINPGLTEDEFDRDFSYQVGFSETDDGSLTAASFFVYHPNGVNERIYAYSPIPQVQPDGSIAPSVYEIEVGEGEHFQIVSIQDGVFRRAVLAKYNPEQPDTINLLTDLSEENEFVAVERSQVIAPDYGIILEFITIEGVKEPIVRDVLVGLEGPTSVENEPFSADTYKWQEGDVIELVRVNEPHEWNMVVTRQQSRIEIQSRRLEISHEVRPLGITQDTEIYKEMNMIGYWTEAVYVGYETSEGDINGTPITLYDLIVAVPSKDNSETLKLKIRTAGAVGFSIGGSQVGVTPTDEVFTQIENTIKPGDQIRLFTTNLLPQSDISQIYEDAWGVDCNSTLECLTILEVMDLSTNTNFPDIYNNWTSSSDNDLIYDGGYIKTVGLGVIIVTRQPGDVY